jgi:hypothetical protein
MDLNEFGRLTNFWKLDHSWWIGLVTVIAMSYSRFNTPPTSRSSTTFLRYHALAFSYTLVLIIFWIVVANTPDIVGALAGLAKTAEWKNTLDWPVYIAVLVTLLASVPPFAKIDSAVRRFFQTLARIPWEVQRLSAALRQRTWIPEDEFEAKVREVLLRDADFPDEAISFSSERTPQALWTRITVLQKHIETWETRSGRFSGFYFENKDTIRDLTNQHKDLSASALRVFPMLKLSDTPGEGEVRNCIQRVIGENFVVAARQLEEKLCDFFSRGVLTCGRTAKARGAEFDKIGFMVNISPGHLSDHMVGLYLGLTLWYVALMVYLHRPYPELTGMVNAASYVGAILMAFWFKRWDWANPIDDNLPIRGYILSAVAAFGFATLASFGLGVLTASGVVTTWLLLWSKFWPWSLMSASVSAFVAYLLDQKERSGMRWQETLGTALWCALWAIPVVYLIRDGYNGTDLNGAPPYWRVMIVSAVTGGLIGFFVPSWHRTPLTTVSWYERFKILVTTRTEFDRGLVATIDVFPPQELTGPGRPAVRLPHVVYATSTDDAVADAVRSARAWIKTSRQQRQPDLLVDNAAALGQQATTFSLKATL